jgi:hypothetical protein
MARLARVVVPGLPHHLTQRGNRRQPTFFCDGDSTRWRLRVVGPGFPVFPLSKPARSGPIPAGGPRGLHLSAVCDATPPSHCASWEFFADDKPFVRRDIRRSPASGRSPESASGRRIKVSGRRKRETARRGRWFVHRGPTRPLPLPTDGPDAGTMAHPERRTAAIAISNPPAYTGAQALEKGFENCHLLPRFGTPGAPPWRQASRLKSIKSRSIGHDLCVLRPSRRRGGIGAAQTATAIPPDVHSPERTSLPRFPGRWRV